MSLFMLVNDEISKNVEFGRQESFTRQNLTILLHEAPITMGCRLNQYLPLDEEIVRIDALTS